MRIYTYMCESCYKMRRSNEFKKHYGYKGLVCNTCIRGGRPRKPSKKLHHWLEAQRNVEHLMTNSECAVCKHRGHPKSWPYFWERNIGGKLLPLGLKSKDAIDPELRHYRFLCHICVVYVENGYIHNPFFKRYGERYEDLLEVQRAENRE